MTSSKPPVESADYYDLLAWAMIHKNRLIIGGVTVLVAVLLGGAWRWQTRQREVAASEALFAVGGAGGSRSEQSLGKPEDYLRIVSDYSGTHAAERSMLLAAAAQFQAGKFAEAQAQFDRFRAEQADSLLVPEALYGSAASLDAQGKTQEALALYQDVVTRYPNSGVASRAKLSIAAIHELAGKPTEALKIYDELNRPSAPTVWGSEVATRRSRLLALHPELDPELNRQSQPQVTITRVPDTNAPAGGSNAPAGNLPQIQIQQP